MPTKTKTERERLFEQCVAHGLKPPKRATIAQLRQLLETVDETPEQPPEGTTDTKDVETFVDETDEPEKPEPSTDVAIVGQTAVGLPEIGRWQQMVDMSQVLAQSELVPVPLRKKPADVLLVLLGCHDLGIASTTGFTKLYPIEGKLTMAAELMSALVQARGHDVWPADTNDSKRATAYGKRKGSDRVIGVTFTIEEAEAVTFYDRKKNRRMKLTEKDNWQNYPADMLWARALSRLVRRVFPDTLCGITYTPDELGATVDEDGNVIDVTPREPAQRVESQAAAPATVSADDRAELQAEIGKLDAKQTGELQRRWKDAKWGTLRESTNVPQLLAEHVPLVRELIARVQAPNCGICGATDDLHEDADGGTVCTDRKACNDRVTSKAKENVEARQQQPDDDALEECAACHVHGPRADMKLDEKTGRWYCDGHEPM